MNRRQVKKKIKRIDRVVLFSEELAERMIKRYKIKEKVYESLSRY